MVFARRTAGRALIGAALGAMVLQEAGAQPFFTGFADADGNHFIAQPLSRPACQAREALMREAKGLIERTGQVVVAPQREPERRFAALVFDGKTAVWHPQLTLPLNVAVRREATLDDKSPGSEQQGGCWYASAPLQRAGQPIVGTQAQAEEVALVVAWSAPGSERSAPALRALPGAWRNYAASPKEGTVQLTLPLDELPAPLLRWLAHPAVVARLGDAQSSYRKGLTHVFAQDFSAVLEKERGIEPLQLIGTISATAGGAQYNVAWSINRVMSAATGGAETTLQPLAVVGPSGDERRTPLTAYAPEVAFVADLDGDGSDEFVLRARHFEGSSIRIWRFGGSGLTEVHRGVYEGQ